MESFRASAFLSRQHLLSVRTKPPEISNRRPMASKPCALIASHSYKAVQSQLWSTAHRTTCPFSTAAILNNTKRKRMSKEDIAAARRKARAAKNTNYLTEDLTHQVKYSLCDAMRIIRATEVGYAPNSPKYEMHIKLRTPKDGPVLRNRLSLPHPVRTDVRVCVICPDKMAGKARAAGAVLAGLDDVFAMVKEGKIEFDKCIAHESVLSALQKSGVARILGPKRLMPSVKEKTVVKDVVSALREMSSAAEYRERMSVVRMPVGQLGFTPEQMSKNIQAFMGSVKRDIANMSDRVNKDIHEVVLSSTHGPGLSLNGEFASVDGIRAQELMEH